MSKQVKWDRVEKVRQLASEGKSYREIARIFGVHHTTILRDFHRKKVMHRRAV